MATLITEQELRDAFNIDSEVASGQLTRPIAAASRRLQTWVTSEVYADAALDGTATNQERREDLDYAEALLAMHFGIVGFNTQISPDGVVKQAKDEGATVLQYMGPKETQELQDMFLHQAEQIAAPYRAVPGEEGVEVVETVKPTFFTTASARRCDWDF